MEEGVRSLWAGDVWRGICSGGSEARGKRIAEFEGVTGTLSVILSVILRSVIQAGQDCVVS